MYLGINCFFTFIHIHTHIYIYICIHAVYVFVAHSRRLQRTRAPGVPNASVAVLRAGDQLQAVRAEGAAGHLELETLPFGLGEL